MRLDGRRAIQTQLHCLVEQRLGHSPDHLLGRKQQIRVKLWMRSVGASERSMVHLSGRGSLVRFLRSRRGCGPTSDFGLVATVLWSPRGGPPDSRHATASSQGTWW
jgi:hypothetical protein